jgi:Rha family phage regulatory protein
MQLVINHKNQVSTTSRLIAQKFGKRHDNVLRAIENLECSTNFQRLNFELSLYTRKLSAGGSKQEKEFIITRDGFTMLVMAFTGPKAAQFKEEYIEEFNRMEAVIRMEQSRPPTLLATYTERVLSEPTKDCPRTHFTVFDAAHPIMLFIEKHIGSVSKYDLVDASIGARWVKYREGKEWAEDHSYYIHEYKDERGRRECKCYKNSEYNHFKNWLLDVYKATYLYEYLHSKYSKEKNALMLSKIESVLPKLLKAS